MVLSFRILGFTALVEHGVVALMTSALGVFKRIFVDAYCGILFAAIDMIAIIAHALSVVLGFSMFAIGYDFGLTAFLFRCLLNWDRFRQQFSRSLNIWNFSTKFFEQIIFLACIMIHVDLICQLIFRRFFVLNLKDSFLSLYLHCGKLLSYMSLPNPS